KIKRLFGDFEEVEIDGKIVEREVPDYTNNWFPGSAIDRIWNYNVVGVWQVNEKDEANAYGLEPGDFKAQDVKNDGIYNEFDDKQFIGYSQPKFRIGFRNNFTLYGNFSASVFVRADLGHLGAFDYATKD